MIIFLILSCLIWLSPIRAELVVINSTIITIPKRGCMQSGRVVQGRLELQTNNLDVILSSFTDVPCDGFCPNGTILIGPAVKTVFGDGEELLDVGRKAKCLKFGRIEFGLAQSAQSLIPEGICNQSIGVFLSSDTLLQTVESDQIPYLPAAPFNFEIALSSFDVISAVVVEGYVEYSGQLYPPTSAINESCLEGDILLKPGVVANNDLELIVINSSTCIEDGELKSGSVFFEGIRGFTGDLEIESGVAILSELPPTSTINTLTTSTCLSATDTTAVTTTVFSTVTTTAFLQRTQACPTYPQYSPQQPHGYGNYNRVGSQLRSSGYPLKRDRGFNPFPFNNKAEKKVGDLISAKIKNKLDKF